ncbi:MAG TPA: YihY/virulence factor BrkB family protein [Tepidisphaeraceae bacterium]|nr:YihY/virulence factor BrkB family protein [Tepidisphaeraceae bacterium]
MSEADDDIDEPTHDHDRAPRQGWVRAFFSMAVAAANEWWSDNTFRLAASLAFYVLFSIAPIMVITIAVAELALGYQRDAAQSGVVQQFAELAGPAAAEAVEGMLSSAQRTGGGPLALVIGIGTLLLGSTVVFAELQSALNQIWDVRQRPGTSMWRGVVRTRLRSFAIALSVGFLLLVSLVLSAAVAALEKYLGEHMPEAAAAWRVANVALSFVVVAVLFALIYKYLPDARITWRDVGVGAAVTSFLFTLGKYVIGLYLGQTAVASSYGAAGSLAVLLIWFYYSGLICFYGAEFTQVFARRYGSRIRAKHYAERVGAKPDEV